MPAAREKRTAVPEETEVILAFTGRADDRQAEAFTPAETGEGVAAEELKQFIERIERLDEEKKAISDDRRDVLAEAKGRGFSTKAINALVKLRAMEPHVRAEEEAILELYKSAIGMV